MITEFDTIPDESAILPTEESDSSLASWTFDELDCFARYGSFRAALEGDDVGSV